MVKEVEPLYENNDIYKAFTFSESLFSSDIERKYLCPLGSYYFKHKGQVREVLLATPFGDEEGLIGNNDYGEHCGGEWLTYSRKDGKWCLDCSESELLKMDYMSDDVRNSYDERTQFFESNGFLLNYASPPEKAPLIDLGVIPYSGYNWFGRLSRFFNYSLTEAGRDDGRSSNIVNLKDADGRDYVFLGVVTVSLYCGPLMPDVFFFYNPDKDRVLVVFEYT